ncbi:MAG: DUF4249 family protein [Balneolaceae bacterium]|nr:DUF4249 family protein [Balneolaceae bacterium]
MRYTKTFILVILAAVIAGCDLYPQDEFEENYVVESYLVADRDLAQVRITRSVPIDREFSAESASVDNAEVRIRLLDASGSPEQTYAYAAQSAGIYIPENPEPVLPLRTYELQVTISGTGEVIRSTTTVPGAFTTIGSVVDSIAYQDPAQVVINTTPTQYPGRDQAFFIFNVNAIDPRPENLTPFYSDLVNEQDENIRNYYKNSSGIINEDNYNRNADGTLTLRVPWLAVAFYENNFIVANAIDDNIYDFVRTQEVQSGPSTLPPGEFQNVRNHVEGGIGIFGSLASDTVRVFIERGIDPQ